MRSLVPLHHVRRNFPFRKLPHASPQLLLFFRKSEFHDVFPFCYLFFI